MVTRQNRPYVLLPILLILTAIGSSTSWADTPDSLIKARADQDSAELWARQRSQEAHSLRNSTDLRTGASGRPVRMVRAYVPACEGNWPYSPDSLGTLCPTAMTLCAASAHPGDLGYWVFTAPAGAPRETRSSWQATGEFACRGARDGGNPAAAEPVVTGEDFRRLPIPAAAIKVQPPNRRTLVNIPTNLYAGASTVVLPTTVLGQAVRVRATPMRFHWIYGDGTARTTADPGAPYPELRTAHVYHRAGTPTLGLATTYSGEYSVAGGPWQPIEGLATVTSPGTDLTVLEAHNHLVADPVP